MAVERWAGFLHKPWKIPRQHSAATERTAYEGHHWLLRQGKGKQMGNVMVVLNFIQADQEQILRSHWLLMTRIEISLAKISIFIPSACTNVNLYLKKSFSYCKNKICKDFRPLCVWPSCYGLKDAVDWFSNRTGIEQGVDKQESPKACSLWVCTFVVVIVDLMWGCIWSSTFSLLACLDFLIHILFALSFCHSVGSTPLNGAEIFLSSTRRRPLTSFNWAKSW